MHRMAYGYRVFVCSNMAFAGEFSPVFAKHSRSFSLIDSLAIGVDRMQRSFGPMQKKGRKGSMREKGIDGRHREVESFRLGDQSGTTPFVNTSAVPSTDLVKLPPSRLQASVKVRDQVSHPLRRDSGKSSNRNRLPLH